MSDRGEHRAIYSVVVTSPDFHALTPDARLLWYTLKLALPACGLDVVYGDQLVDGTGMDRERVSRAGAELIEKGWLEVEGRVHWLPNGLKYDPHISPNNPKHRSFIEKHVAGLPRLPIVARFCDKYELSTPWDDTLSDTLSDTYPVGYAVHTTTTTTNTTPHSLRTVSIDDPRAGEQGVCHDAA